MKLAVDTKPEGFLPPGHVDKGGEVYHAPIKGHEHVGLGGMEVHGLSRRGDRLARPGQRPRRPEAGLERSHGLHVQADRRHHDPLPGRASCPPVDKVTMREQGGDRSIRSRDR